MFSVSYEVLQCDGCIYADSGPPPPTPRQQAQQQWRQQRTDNVAATKATPIQHEEQAVKIQAAVRGRWGRARAEDTRRQLGEALFKQILSFDANSNGCIDQDEMMAYLKAVGTWGTDPLYSDEQWTEGWPIVCQLLGASDTQQGIPMASFLKYTERYRSSGNLHDDLKLLSKLSGGTSERSLSLQQERQLVESPQNPGVVKSFRNHQIAERRTARGFLVWGARSLTSTVVH